MTPEEYKVVLDTMTDSAFAAFRRRFGGAYQTRQEYVDHFVHHPEHERRICQLLGVPTQEDRQTEAAITSAEAARSSSRSARWSIAVALLSLAVSIAALFLAWLGRPA